MLDALAIHLTRPPIRAGRLDRRAILDKDGHHLSGARRGDLGERRHSLDQHQRVAGLHDGADLDERPRVGLRAHVGIANNWRFDRAGMLGGDRYSRWHLRGDRVRGGRYVALARDADLQVAMFDLKLAEVLPGGVFRPADSGR
jgi:hypothetical protein